MIKMSCKTFSQKDIPPTILPSHRSITSVLQTIPLQRLKSPTFLQHSHASRYWSCGIHLSITGAINSEDVQMLFPVDSGTFHHGTAMAKKRNTSTTDFRLTLEKAKIKRLKRKQEHRKFVLRNAQLNKELEGNVESKNDLYGSVQQPSYLFGRQDSYPTANRHHNSSYQVQTSQQVKPVRLLTYQNLV